MLQPGDLLGNRYKVESLIAKGGMGCVYLVRDGKLNNKELAVKEIIQDNNEMFVEEAQILMNLTHPYIPKITDYFEPDANGMCYLVMEYINGLTLQQVFENAGRTLPLPTILKYMLQLCEILSYLHNQAKPIIFRDLKPTNMMIDEYDNIRLIDFGIARKYDQGKLMDTAQMGTIVFAAPEQFENKQTDPRTDIYAVGGVLYYLLTGGKYFFHNNEALSKALSHLPHQLIDLIQQMLEPDLELRVQTITAVFEHLKLIKMNIDNNIEEARSTQTVKIKAEDRNMQATSGQWEAPSNSSFTSYTTQATQSNPALIIYLLDVSGSMTMMNGEKRRIDIVTESLYVALRQMVYRSTKGSRISPRYRVAIFAYSDEVHDLLGGIKKIDELMNTGALPSLTTYRFTDTAKAFLQAEQLLKAELPFMQDCPAPLICHMTDGVYTGEDPQPIVRRIMEMSVKDGNVLVENIFISDDVMEQEIDQPKRWQGIREDTAFRDSYGYQLKRMSSVIPESYREMMRDANYSLAKDSLLMFPGTHPDLVSLGFQMSAATPIY